MSVLAKLRKLGDRLGIVEVSRVSPSAAPVKIPTRSITLSELTMTIQTMDVRSLAESPAELLIPFDEVFKAAGIVPPASGWSVEKLCEFLDSETTRGMDRAQKQRDLVQQLAAENVDAADVIRDAVSRDQALDAFADSIRKKRQHWVSQKRQEIQEIEKQIAQEDKEWKEWSRKKRQREQEMARAVEYLIDKTVISVDEG